MTSVRDFPCTYTELDKHLGDRRSRTLCNNTTAAKDLAGTIVVKLHGHTIAELYGDGSVFVRDAGWRTATTKQRLNEILRPLGLGIGQRDYRWRFWDGQSFSDWTGEHLYRPAPLFEVVAEVLIDVA